MRVLLVAGMLLALLDFAGLLLLAPFLAYVGTGGAPQGAAVRIAQRLLGPDVGAEQVVLILALAAVTLFIVKGAASVTLLWIQSGILFRAQADLSERIVRRYVGASWLRQQETDTGTLLRSAGQAAQNAMSTIAYSLGAFAELAVFAAIIAGIVVVDPLLAAGGVAYLGIAGWIYLRVIRRSIEQRGAQVQEEARRANVAVVELVGGIRELTVRDSAEAYAARFDAANRRLRDALRVIWVSNAAMRYFLEMLMIAGVALVIGIAAMTGSAAAALVSVGILLAGGLRLVPSLSTLLIAVNNLRANSPAIAVVEAELAHVQALEPATVTEDLGALPSHCGFAFRDVAYRYPTRAEPAVTGLDFAVAHGEAIGIVGSTGSGKTTLVDLMLGLLEPDEGVIEVGGAPLRDHLHAWRSRIGFVPQDIFLADDTLAANISFGLPEAPDADRHLARAVSLAHLDDVVAMLPDGLGTVLGERGVRLSGGQRQRVGLARALYGDPSILILDEATSALDNETERSIGEALQSLHGQLTMVVIAHRLSTVRACDRIAFLEAGRVTGIGTFDELARDHAGFARLVELGSLGETG